jgi:hypothetical protein
MLDPDADPKPCSPHIPQKSYIKNNKSKVMKQIPELRVEYQLWPPASPTDRQSWSAHLPAGSDRSSAKKRQFFAFYI